LETGASGANSMIAYAGPRRKLPVFPGRRRCGGCVKQACFPGSNATGSTSQWDGAAAGPYKIALFSRLKSTPAPPKQACFPGSNRGGPVRAGISTPPFLQVENRLFKLHIVPTHSLLTEPRNAESFSLFRRAKTPCFAGFPAFRSPFAALHNSLSHIDLQLGFSK
jgi:hypothetical protein